MREMEHALVVKREVIVEDPPDGMAITVEPTEDGCVLIQQWDDGLGICTPESVVVTDAHLARKLAGWLCRWAAAQEQDGEP